MIPGRRPYNKFRNQKTEYPPGSGQVYDSKLEANRAAELDLLLAAGEITSWQRGTRWVLADACTRPDGKRDRAIVYIPDFEVRRGDVVECEDVKGKVLPLFKVKLRLWWRVYPTTPLYIIRADGTRSLS